MEFTKQLISTTENSTVVAFCRTPSVELNNLQQSSADRLHIVNHVDLANDEAIVAACDYVKTLGRVDLLVNCSGILGAGKGSKWVVLYDIAFHYSLFCLSLLV